MSTPSNVVRSGLIEHWDSDGWRILRYSGRIDDPGAPRPVSVRFALDVSASMTDAERKLAKSFFFFVLQGIRRRYAKVETRFIAHTTHTAPAAPVRPYPAARRDHLARSSLARRSRGLFGGRAVVASGHGTR